MNYLSVDGAHKLKANIVNFWVAQGYSPEVIDIEVLKLNSETAVLRSNLRNGTPPGPTPPRQGRAQ